MGKKGRLNRFISKWIKSDLPEDHSTVLLLGVTRISSSPSPARRPCSLPLTSPSPNLSDNSARSRRRSFSSRRTIIRRNSSRKVRREQDPPGDDDGRGHVNETSSGDVTPSNRNSNDHPPPSSPCPVMDKSVDSIGTCSLDVEASADISDHSEDAASIGTLRSVALPTPSPEPHLPSYLSLACTVNGYSTTTNYDPERLSKSRDASPHRPYDYDHHQNHLTPVNTYCIQNNLLSPPNLVPPPPTKTTANMSNNALTHQQIYNSSTTMKFATRESRSSFTKNGYSVDKVDACIENTVFNSESRFNKYQRSAVTVNGQNDRHSKSMNDKLLDEDLQDIGMKQSSSSPTLPVLRHLRPEFRAQLPVISPRKLGETIIQKSITVPKITENVNGHSKETVVVKDAERNGSASCEESSNNLISKDKALVKDGHYFLEICAKEINRLLQLADQAERESLLEELSEDVKGKLRAAYGKARLLVSQKIEQFKGLCANNINQSTDEQFPTTSEDLQGFWDMVMLQVDEVNTLFNDIERLRKNNWQVEVVDAPDTNKTNGVVRKQKKTNIARPSTAGSEELRKHRDAQRKAMMEERRKAMKSLKPSESIEIFVPESS